MVHQQQLAFPTFHQNISVQQLKYHTILQISMFTNTVCYNTILEGKNPKQIFQKPKAFLMISKLNLCMCRNVTHCIFRGNSKILFFLNQEENPTIIIGALNQIHTILNESNIHRRITCHPLNIIRSKLHFVSILNPEIIISVFDATIVSVNAFVYHFV